MAPTVQTLLQLFYNSLSLDLIFCITVYIALLLSFCAAIFFFLLFVYEYFFVVDILYIAFQCFIENNLFII